MCSATRCHPARVAARQAGAQSAPPIMAVMPVPSRWPGRRYEADGLLSLSGGQAPGSVQRKDPVFRTGLRLLSRLSLVRYACWPLVIPGRPSRNTWAGSLPPMARSGLTPAAPLETGADDLLADEEHKRPADPCQAQSITQGHENHRPRPRSPTETVTFPAAPPQGR